MPLMTPLPIQSLILAALIATVSACGGASPTPPPTPVILDTDRDGVVDTNDSAPADPLCSAASDASGGVCYARTLAAARPKVIGSANGKVYFSSDDGAPRLYGYDMLTQHFIGRLSIAGYTPTSYAYSPDHARLYVGDVNGKVHSYSETLLEGDKLFASVPSRIDGLAAAGKYLMVQDDSGSRDTHWVFDKQGMQTDSKDASYYSAHYDWNQATSTLYFFRDNIIPNDLMFEVIDQVTGKIVSKGESPQHGAYAMRGPIRSNPSGTKVLLGTGDLYGTADLAWEGSLGTQPTDGAWIANNELMTLSPSGAQTRLVRFSADKVKLEERYIDGEALAVSVHGNANYLIVKKPTHIELLPYVASNDSDGDSILNLSDKFPLDKTAAVDTDNDGHPDGFLGSYTAADSPTGLTKDVYPRDAHCHAIEQGDGVNCNFAAVIPAYVPDQVVTDGKGIVYLLSKTNARVYRWSLAKANYISPLVIGQKTALTNTAPNTMSYSADHQRMYFGYGSGQVSYINLSGDTREVNLVALASEVNGLAAVGKFLLVQDNIASAIMHHLIDSSGKIVDSKGLNYYSSTYEWSAAPSRIYFFRDGIGPNDLMFETIDQASGKISGKGESPYHGKYAIGGPIRASAGGARILLGSGDIYSGSDLTVVKSLGFAFHDAQWLADGSLLIMMVNGANTNVTLYGPGFDIVKNQTFPGAPLALLNTGNGITVVTHLAGKPTMGVFPL
jgi:hypothetical protein